MASQNTRSSDLLEARLLGLDDDPAERKRLLGVLAQRRYRQRKRAARDKATKYAQRGPAHEEQSMHSVPQPGDLAKSCTGSAVQDETIVPMSSSVTTFSAENGSSGTTSGSSIIYEPFPAQIDPITEITPAQSHGLDIEAPFGLNVRMNLLEDVNQFVQRSNDPDEPFPLDGRRIENTEADGPFSDQEEVVNLPTTTAADTWSANTVNSDFFDDWHISTPALCVIRAHITILKSIRGPEFVLDTIWNPYAESPFYCSPDSSPCTTVAFDTLRPNYIPTISQLTVPHHPVMDLLPWPSVRDKILQLLCLPIPFRPHKLRETMPNVTMALKHDLMCPVGGMRISGTDPFNPENWEIGQTVFEGWWWALDGGIVRRSNAMRRARGEDELRLGGRKW